MAEEEVSEIREKVEELRASIERQIRRVREIETKSAKTDLHEEMMEPRSDVREKVRGVVAEVNEKIEGETERALEIERHETLVDEEARKDKKRHIDMMAKEIDSVLDEATDRINELRKMVKDRVKMHENALKD
jgi:hypothetical protein